MDSKTQEEIKTICSQIAEESGVGFILLVLDEQTAYEFKVDGEIIERDKGEAVWALKQLEKNGVLDEQSIL